MTMSRQAPAAGPHRPHTLRAQRDGMRWRRAIACLVPTLCLAACHDSATPHASAASMRPYPGFVQVAQTGDAAAWRFDPTHIAQADRQYTIHVIHTLASAGSATPDYVAFDVVTDCLHSARRLSGTRYHDDGVAGALYPGDATPQQAEGGSMIAQLLARACPALTASSAPAAAVTPSAIPAAATAATADAAVKTPSSAEPGLIRGTFSSRAALELLYGTYDVNTESAAWLDPAIPATLAARDKLHDAPGEPVIVRNVAVIDFPEGGHEKKLFVTSGMPVSGGCDACTGLLGLAVFVQTAAGWQVESNAPYVASLGTEGAIGKRVAWTGSQTQGYALVIDDSASASSANPASRVVFARRDGRFVQVAAATTATAPANSAPLQLNGAAQASPSSSAAAAVPTSTSPAVATAAVAALGMAAIATRHQAASPRKPARQEHVDASTRSRAESHRDPAPARAHELQAQRHAEKASRTGAPAHPPAHSPTHPPVRHVAHVAVKP
ncbi:MAG: hypothetical protein ACRYHA_33420 [Janthinobacterium lividum]